MTVKQLKELLSAMPDDAKCIEYTTESPVYAEYFASEHVVGFGCRQDMHDIRRHFGTEDEQNNPIVH